MNITVSHRLVNAVQFVYKNGDMSLPALISHLEMLHEAGFDLKQIKFDKASLTWVSTSLSKSTPKPRPSE